MKHIQPADEKKRAVPLSGWIGIGILCLFLVVSIWFAVEAWERAAGVAVSTNGKIAMLLGIVVTALLGAGLMALVFWSNRKGYDR
jgi:nitrate reductase gamma subunit